MLASRGLLSALAAIVSGPWSDAVMGVRDVVALPLPTAPGPVFFNSLLFSGISGK
jgi:hypothetical protein